MALFLATADVRDYLQQPSTTGRFSDAQIGSNIRAAQAFLQRQTGRQFEPQEDTTKVFTTLGRAIVTIPDLRSASSVAKNTSDLVADSGYHLLPDRMSTGIYTGIQFRVPSVGYGDWYKSDPLWWDKNLDRPPWGSGSSYSSEANDLVITGDWGYNPQIPGTAPVMPDDVLHAVKVLASFYTLRPQSVLAGAQVTPEGALLSYRELPMEVRGFIDEWTLGEQAVAVAGV
jgi:hypothetical protein